MRLRLLILFVLFAQLLLMPRDISAVNASSGLNDTQRPTSVFFSDDFESGLSSSAWITTTALNGVVEIDNVHPHNGANSVFLGQKVAGGAVASLILAINLSGQNDVLLDFWVRRTGHGGYPTSTGVFISENSGARWIQILPLNDISQNFSHKLLDIARIAAANQLILTNKFQIRFTYSIDPNSPNDGLVIDDVRLTQRAQEIATFPFAQDSLETGTFQQGFYPQSYLNGVVEINTEHPHSGANSVFLGQKVAGGAVASLILAIDLTGQNDVLLDFWVRRTGHGGYPTTTGVFISENGEEPWIQLRTLNDISQNFSHEVFDIASTAAANGLTLSNKFQIRFTYSIDPNSPNDGLIIDDVRLAPRAQAIATFPFMQDSFETGTFQQGLYPQSFLNGVVEINSDHPHSGTNSVFLGQKVAGGAVASLVLAVDLAGQTDVLLDFWVRRTGHGGYPTTTGVFIAENQGAVGKQILPLNNISESFNHEILDIASAAAANGLTLSNKFQIRFTYSIDPNSPNDGLVIDDVKLVKTSLSGKIYNEAVVSGNEVSGAFVEACLAGGACQTTTSHDNGSYQFGDLPPGSYTLRALPPANNNHLIGNLGPITLAADTPLANQDIILPKANGMPADTTVVPALPPIDGVPVINWTTSVVLSHKGCAGGTATYQVFVDGVVKREGTLVEAPPGAYSVTLAPFRPVHGNIRVVVTLQCPNGTQPSVNFNIWIDPSGFVVNTLGNPITGATVTLYSADKVEGPFALVANGSAVMSPANRVNPMTTESTGRFGWDVIAGYYRVRAEKKGCTAPGSTQAYNESAVLTIPPPVTDLKIVLFCGEAQGQLFLPIVRR